ncbi:helicase HerA domain-containing protein [Micromonospora sp. DT229]|uniref:helicase HerA domain-containing protein n=1 Tax=Micromonospora sp. DT229 TaxID=3393430 RepID=UPI003CEE45EB
MNSELPPTLIDYTAQQLSQHMLRRQPGHCVRVDDLIVADARAVAARVAAGLADPVDIHVLTKGVPQDTLEITPDRAVELRNRKRAPLLLLVPAGTSHAASSLDNSFEPVPLIELLKKATAALEKQLASTAVASTVTEVRRVLGRARRVEPWARFLAAVVADPSIGTVGRELWRVGLIPDLGKQGIERRLRHNAKAVSMLARPLRPTARVADRLVAAEVKEGDVRESLLSFFERQDAGELSDPISWTRQLGDHHAGTLTFDQWPLTETQQTALSDIAVTPFRRENGSLDPQCKLRVGEGGRLYCEVSPDNPGSVVVKWTTEPAKVTSVATWRVEVLPPADLRAPDTVPVAATKVRGGRRRATLRVDATEDDLALGTLFVIRVRAQDADGNDLDLEDGRPAAADSDQFEIELHDHVPERNPRKAGAPSLAEAVLRTAVEAGGSLAEDGAAWDSAGQVFTLRVGRRRMVLIPVSRVIAALQERMIRSKGEEAAFDAHSPLSEAVNAVEVSSRPLRIPPALADRRRRLLAAIGDSAPRDLVETLEWTDDLRNQARSYLQSYRRALDTVADAQARSDLLVMDTLTVRVGTASEDVHGLVLLPTHPLRLAWVAAHDRLLREWAAEAAAGSTKAKREALIDLALVSRLTPANLPFTVVDPHGRPMVYAEELTHGAVLYLPPDSAEPEAASDVICAALDISRASPDMSAVAQALTNRIHSYRRAHPGTGAMRMMSVNPGSGAALQRALRPIVLPSEARDPEEQSQTSAAPRMEVIAYSDRLSYTDPVSELRRLQLEVASSETDRSPSHLTPAMGLAVRDLDRLTADHEGHHLAVIQDLARTRVTDPPTEAGSRTASFQDLLTSTASLRGIGDEATNWYIVPTLKARGAGRLESEIVEAHRAHQAAVAASLGLGTTIPAIMVSLGRAELDLLRAAHERADWVATIDHGIGYELFEASESIGFGGGRYLLDYAPDFLEGMGRRLTITTGHDDEVLHILADAMRGLGLSPESGGASNVLGRLMVVSGRLALRLLGDNTLADEAVSLAALIAHLEQRNQLDGRIIVPVDAHPEIFGPQAGSDDEPARRCDLLLIRITQRSLRIECVEVKARRDAVLPQHLADRIVDQLENTERVLQRQFFATDPPRLDATLQRARLVGLLHYYAERSGRYGLIAADKLDEVHRNIDRLEELADPPELTKRGYVVSLRGSAGFPAKHRGVPISVLTADNLGKAGFTAISDVRQAERIVPREPRPAPSAKPPTAHTGSPGRPRETDGNADPVKQTVRPQPAPAAQASAESESHHERANEEARSGPTAAGAGAIGVELGQDGGGAPVNWEVSTKGSPHAFILGIPGQGKSVTTRRVVHEFARQGLPSLILDFHGDMAAAPPAGAHVLDAAAGLPFSPFELNSTDPGQISQTAWEVAEVIAYVCGLGDIQRGHVYKALREAYLSGADAVGASITVPTMEEFADAVEQVEEGARGRNARDRIRPLTDFGLFSTGPTGAFPAAWNAGVVIDLSRLSLETVQLAASAFILRKIYREMFRWQQDGRMRLAVVLDEAHRLAKDVTLPKLMKEGRKYGLSVIVASQGAADFHRDVLGNAGTKIVFRTNYPASKAVAGFLRGRDGQDLSQQIEQLSVGSAYVSTPEQAQARRIYMHQ